MEDMDVYFENQADSTKGIDALMGWIGGKSQLRGELASRIPEQSEPISKRRIKYYVEVFGGMAWMLLYKPRWFQYEIYNDANLELVNLLTIVKEHPREFWRVLREIPNSEFYFKYLTKNDGLTDVQRAVTTFIKYQWSFSSNGRDYAGRPVSKFGTWKKVKQITDRLDRVGIFNKSYRNLIPRYNKPHVFLYLDPPYYGKEEFYDARFTAEDHGCLADLLTGFKGQFMLSYNDCSEVRELYKNFKIEAITTTYSALGKVNGAAGNELIITNY